MFEDADDLARWLATDPPVHAQDQVIDRLVATHGSERGLRVWSDAARLVRPVETW